MSLSLEAPSLFNNTSFLISSLKQKNLRSFEFVYDKYSTPLYSLIAGIVNNPFSADIVLERVFKILWTKVACFDEIKSSLFTWMIGIARKEALIEKKQIEHRLQKDHENATVTNMSSLSHLIEELSEPCKSVLKLSFFENRTDGEIAFQMKDSIESVKECRTKALLILNRLLGNKAEIKKPSLISERVLAF